ncbi:PKD domain-containing protein [Telluribacter sp. SYSU D00476]|uniref:PKD domain-containing protein n=1 Tax=Telluribacter sp. SYSU D00476 TaxID=2811430 RepID=UPI001FF1A59F|nr:Ig-like domain-containing protein [Telluribacter sp. SYSU D00476]
MKDYLYSIKRVTLLLALLSSLFCLPDALGQSKGPDRNQYKGKHKLKKQDKKLPKEKLKGKMLDNAKFNFKASKLKGVTAEEEGGSKGGRLAVTATLKNPTSLQFGPDGRLYISQQNGLIKVYTIAKNAPGDYTITGEEVISIINSIPNHNDDGTPAPTVKTRQITGLVVAGTAQTPILYVSSSDSRIGGPSGDLNLDTNSGIISKLTKTSTGWDKVDLVRGFPRSEENHSTNGMQLDGTMLYMVIGGNTNAGAPSKNFAYQTEYALTTAVLSIDLAAVEAMPTQGSGNTKYKYDLPTLDDPTRPGNPDSGDPFGGNDGLNQAKLVPGGPVQIFATGFRNAYDLVITKTPGKERRMYVTDNGANQGWGGHPASEGVGTATNNYVVGEPGSSTAGPNDPKVNNLDNLHYIGNLNNYIPGSYYAGHPNPIRANPAGAGLYTHDGTTGVWRTSATGDHPLPADWPPVPLDMARPVEGDFQNPGEKDNALLTYTKSTNGIAEYTASNFGAGLQGHLLAASFDGTVQKITLTEDGTDVLNTKGSQRKNLDLPFASNFGGQPLDITTQGDNDIFPGTIWVVCYLESSIFVFEPEPIGGGGGTCNAEYTTAADDDGDGYSNADEIDNATNPCSSASRPQDSDGDMVSDMNDTDDDNDGIPDDADYFALDAHNGTTTNLPIEYELFNNHPGTGLFGLGFTGLMLPKQNGIDYLDLFEGDNLIAGGAVGAFSVVSTTPGDPYQQLNNQENGFQFGVNVNKDTPPFTVHTRLLGPYFDNQTPQYWQALGLFIGTGDQDNYIKIVLGSDGGSGGIEILHENNGKANSSEYTLPGGMPLSTMDLYLSVNPATGMVQPKHSKDGGPITNLGPAIKAGGALLEAIQGAPAMAVGILSTSLGSTPFTATWDLIRVTSDTPANAAPVLSEIGNKTLTVGETLTFTAQATDHDVPAQTLAFSVSGTERASINSSTGVFTWKPITAGTYTFTIKVTDNGVPAQSDEETITVTVNPVTTNQPPTAGAGADQTVTTGSVTLTGSAVDPDGSITTWQWSQQSGPGIATLSGVNTSTLTASNLMAGTYVFRLTVTDNQGVSAYDEVSVTMSSGQQVVSFTLINADTDQPIRNFISTDVLNLATLPTRNISIRANTNPSPVGSVKFVMSGASSKTQTETGFPYALFGDNGGDYNPWTPAVGSYTLTCTPYTLKSATGTAGTPLTITFNVVDQASNQTPTANAGTDHTITLPANSVTINGSATDPDGSIFSYQWSQQSGPGTASLSGANTATLLAGNLVTGTYVFRMAIMDNLGATAFDEVSVTVNPVAANQAPTANAGADQTITLPANTVTLAGSGNDPDGSIAAHQWTQQSGPNTATLVNANTASLTANDLVAGTYTFRLTVTDNQGTTGFDEVSVTVNQAAPANQTPTANAGADQTITLPANTVTLAGSGNDPDGSIAAHQWSQQSGPNTATLVNANTASLTANDLVAGTYTFRLTVTDNQGATAFDDINVVVNDGGIRFNAGGTAFTASGSRQFITDTYFSGGSTYNAGVVGIDNTTDDPLYRTERNGTFSYNVPVGNGTYKIVLHFAEVYLGVKATGTRKFNVDIEGHRKLTEYDITAKVGGPLKAVQETFIVGVTDGTLNIAFVAGSANNPKVSAIEVVPSTEPIPNTAPVLSDIGNKTITAGQTLSFTAQASDTDAGQSLSFSLTGAPQGATIDASTGAFSWIPAAAGSYPFTVKVTDNGSPALSDEEAITVTVNPAVTNQAPVANAGADQTITLPTNTVTLAGSGNDPDGSIAAHQWSQQSGPNTATLVNANTASLTANDLVAGTYTFRLTVTDNQGTTGFDEVSVLVNQASSANQAPVVANAITDQNAMIGTAFNFAFAENTFTDADNDALTYVASLEDGNPLPAWLTFTATSRTFNGTPPGGSPASLSIKVTASDGKGGTATDIFLISISLPENSGAWQTVTPSSGSPTARHESAYVQAGDRFFLLGGRNSKPVQVYDPVAKSWINAAFPPIQLHHFQAVTHEGFVYIAGAFTGSFPSETSVPNIYIYDPKANKWIVGPEIPENRRRGSAGAVVYNNKIYLIGGNTQGHKSGYVPWFDEFDPATNTWKVLPDAPHARDHFQAAIINNKLLAAGGRRSSQNTGQTFQLTVPEVDSYDFATGQWTVLPTNIPTPRAGTASAVLDGELLIIGGESSQPTAHKETEALNPTTNTWRRLADLQQGRHATQAIVNNGSIYIVAGSGSQGGSPELNTQELFSKSGPTTPTGTPLTQSQLLAPSTAPLGQVAVNTSKDTPLSLTNTTGNQAILITAIAVSGSTEFAHTAPYTLPFVLPVGQSITLNVRFSPTSAGNKTATLTITHSGTGGSTVVTLNGEGIGGSNQPPTANAGADQTITLPANTVTLAGSGNDPDGSIAAHQWTQQSGPNTATLVNANTASLTANDLVAGTYTFRLTVTDNQGTTGFDEVSVTVNQAAPANQAPTANAGADQTITLPTNTVTLAGSGNDPDGSIAAHQWTQQSGPNTATLVNANTASLTANDLVAGTYTFRLTVTDNQGATAHDEVSVLVHPAAPTTQQVVSFTLINADTEQPIRDLVPNDVINLATLPTRNLNIRSNTNPSPVGSVKFVMSGKQNRTQTETGFPYALFGDDSGNYRNWTPALGNYSLTATPYTEASAKGTAGTPLTINFSVVDQAGARLAAEGSADAEVLEITFYPNPFAETITLQVRGKGEGKLPAVLFDVTGRVVMQLEDLQAEQTITFGNEVAPGMYFLHIGAGRKVKTYKLIKTY